MTLFRGLLGDTQRAVIRSNVPDTIERRAYVLIGAAGAATVTTLPDSARGVITCAKNALGIYDITFPRLAPIPISVPMIRVWVMLSPAATVARAYVKAWSPTNGTAQAVTFLNTAGTPVEPAPGDLLGIQILAADPDG